MTQTTIDLAEVVSLHTRPADQPNARRAVPKNVTAPGVTRRTFVGGVASVGFGVGLAALGVFPAARPALADGYDIKQLPCPSYASGHNCTPGCGPSTICDDCCVTSGTNYGFFKNDNTTYKLRPNQCSGSYDGWIWGFVGACGPCAGGRTYRCHDGYKKVSGSWANRICKWTTSCSGCC